MNNNIVFFVLLLVNNVVCEVNDNYSCDLVVETDAEFNKIDYDTFCDGPKPCVAKCCAKDEAIHITNKTQLCRKIEDLKREMNNNLSSIPLDFSQLNIYKKNAYKKEKTTKNFLTDFTLVHASMYTSGSTDCYISRRAVESEYLLLENGDLVMLLPNHFDYWVPTKSPEFCVDIVVGRDSKTHKPKFTYIYKLPTQEQASMVAKTLYTASTMLISSFFLLLILLVYGALHQLRNMKGMLLVAYVFTLMTTYTLKGAQLFSAYYNKVNEIYAADCTLISQITYFFMLATFFWLNVMSFDLWWTFRGSRKLRPIHRRGITAKFLIYSVYAYGVPALITVFASVMDKHNLPAHVPKPFFDQCLGIDTLFVYLYIPMTVLIAVNCLLFLMTVYNIWLIRRAMAGFDSQTARNNAHNQNRFWLYLRLGCWMGVGWVLEVGVSRVPDSRVSVGLHVLLSVYNMLTGLVIFIIFICKRKIFVMLCKRFNIQNRWTRDAAKSSSRSDTKSVRSYSRSASRTKSTADCEADDTTGVRLTSLYSPE